MPMGCVLRRTSPAPGYLALSYFFGGKIRSGAFAALWSTRRLRDYRFEWLLPGHGHPVRLPASRMQSEIDQFLTQEGNT